MTPKNDPSRPPRNLHRGWLVAAALCCVQVAAHAGYAQPAPPPGFAGSPGAWTYKAANAAQWLTNGTVRTNAALNVGGRSISVPVGMRVAANAGTFAARFMFANPLLLTAAGVALLVAQNYEWSDSEQKWIDNSSANSYVISSGRQWVHNHSVCGGVKYNSASVAQAMACVWANTNGYKSASIVSHSMDAVYFYYNVLVQPNSGSPFNDSWRFVHQPSSCPSGWYVTPAGCVSTPPPQNVNEEDFVARVAPQIQPAQVPDLIPPTQVPLPVEVPQVNPDPQGNPQPLYVPQGEPQPVPNTDPQQYKQPMLKVQPAPTPSSPLQVDVQPYERISTSPQGISEPVSNPNPDADPATQTAPSDKEDLCAKNPDILACADKPELDLPELETPTSSFNLTYAAENVLGTTGNCPAPVITTINGQAVTVWDWPAHCSTVQTYVRPLVLVLSAFAALMILVGATPGANES